MSVWTLLAYLFGSRESIERIAADPWAVWVGLALTLSTGLARSYATHDLRKQPWRLILPPVAALLLAGLLYTVVAMKLGSGGPKAAPGFRAVAALVLLTAPLAWLYAIPYAHLLNPSLALRARLMTLAVVAAWRVVLISVALAVLMDGNLMASFLLVMLVAAALMLAGLALGSRPRREPSQTPVMILSAMGGFPPSDARSESTKLIAGWSAALVVLCIFSLPVLLAGVLSYGVTAQNWERLADHPPNEPPSPGLWFLSGAAAGFFAGMLPWTQRRPRLRTDLEALFRQRQFLEAVRLLSAHERDDLPAEWTSPPESEFRDAPRLLDVMEAVVSVPATGWVREMYLARFRGYLKEPIWYWFYDTDLGQIGGLLSRLPEGPELARMLLAAGTEFEAKTPPFLRVAGGANEPGAGPALGEPLISPDPEITDRRGEILAGIRRIADEDAGANKDPAGG